MAKLAVAQARLFKNVFLCKHCGVKIQVEPKKILDGKVRCRRCGKSVFRAMKKQ
tara:strand:- start:165 stop:326 length:162 start_codon:yes stop_codon:yes gene_type:complete